MPDLFTTLTLETLSKSLDAAALNQVLLSHNIANVNTPGYKRSEVSFQDQLRRALSSHDSPLVRTNPRHLPFRVELSQVEPRVVLDHETAMRWDGNNVDIEREMAKLSQNSLQFGAFSTLLRRQFDGLRTVILGR